MEHQRQVTRGIWSAMPQPAAMPNWPGQARIAVQFRAQLRRGWRKLLLHGDTHSVAFLSRRLSGLKLSLARAYEMGVDLRNTGSRAGVLAEFSKEFESATCVDGVSAWRWRWSVHHRWGSPWRSRNWGTRIACHGCAGSTTRMCPKRLSVSICNAPSRYSSACTARRPQGWYTGAIARTPARLLLDEGSFVYDATITATNLPFWKLAPPHSQGECAMNHLVVPYTLDTKTTCALASPHGPSTPAITFSAT